MWITNSFELKLELIQPAVQMKPDAGHVTL